MMLKISILTATYNREKLLPKLYQSLVQNSETYANFEWLIMDDGSTDGTNELVSKWTAEKKIDIHYYYQENAGKMAAINNLAKYVTGDIWIEMDSDDVFMDHVLEQIANDYETLPLDAYGILYYKQLNGQPIEMDQKLENQIIKLYDLHYKFGYSYDMALTFRTSIRQQYQYELEKNERFITEARMYYKMDQAYNGLLMKNRMIMNCEYFNDGYTKNILDVYQKYPYGYFEYFKELLNYPRQNILKSKRMYMVKHYILFCTLTHVGFRKAIQNVKVLKNKWLVFLLYWPGKLKTLQKFKNRKTEGME